MTMNILAIAGSLRRDSINRRLLTRLGDRAPAGVSFELFDDLNNVPLFSEDLEQPQAPDGVRLLWTAVGKADAIIFATPEYNQSLPGVTKNAVDWISRDPAGSPLKGKLCAVTGVTAGRWGTRIAQQQLRTVLVTCGAHVLARPALFVAEGDRQASEQELDDFWTALVAECGFLRQAA